MKETELSKFNFHPAQAEVARDDHRYKVVNCGRRWGKTILSVGEMIAKAVNTKDGRIAYVAPNFQQARDIAWDDLKKYTHEFAIKINESRLEITLPSRYPKRTKDNKLVLTKSKQPIFLPSTSRIILRGWEAIESMLGQKFHLLVLDEVARYPNFDEKWKTVLMPTLTDYRGRVIFTSTPLGFNHFYNLFNYEASNKEYKSFTYPSRANPHLPIEDLVGYKDQMSADQYAQEYEAEFRKKEGLVFTDFSRDRHTYTDQDTEPEFSETFYGIDFGFTNPSAVAVIRKDRDANYWITDCIYKSQLTNTELIEKCKQLKHQPRYLYADPAEPDRIKEFTAAGYYMRDVKKGKGSIINGIQRLEELFKTNRIKINATTCLPLITELESYSYPEEKHERNATELPEDKENHIIDGLRYALMTHDPHSHGAGKALNTPYMTNNHTLQDVIKHKQRNLNKKNRNFD